jgi:hypothetical protein
LLWLKGSLIHSFLLQVTTFQAAMPIGKGFENPIQLVFEEYAVLSISVT